MRRRVAILVCAAAAALAAPRQDAASADVDLPVTNGTTIKGTLSPGGEVETFRVALPFGAKLLAVAKSATGGPALRLRLLRRLGDQLVVRTGRNPRLAYTNDSTDQYAVEVTSKDGAATGGYELAISWTTQTSFSRTQTVQPGADGDLGLAADPGTRAAFSVRVPPGSRAKPALVSVSGPGLTKDLGLKKTATVTLVSYGEYHAKFRNTGALAGKLTATVRLTPRRVTKRTIRLTGTAAPVGVNVLQVLPAGPGGAILDADDQGIFRGASIEIPAGALATPTLISFGIAADVEPEGGSPHAAAGPALFLGPEGLTFAAGKPATITLPYLPEFFADGTSLLRVYTRDRNGVVTEVTGLVIDEVAHTVSFPAPHFSSFQAVRADGPTLVAQVARVGSDAGSAFGESVAASSSFVAVGAPLADGPTDAGAVQVYPLTAGVPGVPEVVTAPSAAPADRFGFAVAVSDTVLAVGAPLRETPTGTDAGAVFVYRRGSTTWQFEQELRASQGNAFAGFGASVAVSGNRIVVGTNGEGSVATGAGAAYVFAFGGVTWAEEGHLVPGTSSQGDQAGTSVAIEGDLAVVGAPFDDPSAVDDAGSAFVFKRDQVLGTWGQTDALDGALANGQLGSAVAISGAEVFAGSPGAGAGGGGGMVTVFRGAPGVIVFVHNVFGSGEGNLQFGYSVSATNGTLLAGAVGAPGTAGRAYTFKLVGTNYAFESVTRGSSFGLGADASFGDAVAISGKTIVVGAPRAAGQSGRAFVLGLPVLGP